MREKLRRTDYAKAFKTVVILAMFAFLIVRDNPSRVKYTA